LSVLLRVLCGPLRLCAEDWVLKEQEPILSAKDRKARVRQRRIRTLRSSQVVANQHRHIVSFNNQISGGHQVKSIKVLVAVIFVASTIAALSTQTFGYPPFLIKARKFGAKDCTFCH